MAKSDKHREPSQRQLRVGEELRHALARLFERQALRDPALSGVAITVMEVRVSPDLKHATAFILPLGGAHGAELLAGLARSVGYSRRELAKAVPLRLAPELVFALDRSFNHASRIDELLRRPEVERDLQSPDPDPPAGGEEENKTVKRRGRPVHGWVVLDKPAGMSSAQAVAVVRRIFDAAKAGHAGTLDPLATGVLPVALGEATKAVPYVMADDKRYRFTVRWGVATDTEDAAGAVTATSDARPSRAAIDAALPAFIGEISQVPPAFSALKVAGERAYDLARQGRTVALAARTVTIRRLVLFEAPDREQASFEAEVGKGTYIRALARDLAAALGTLGHVTALRRLGVGRAAPTGDFPGNPRRSGA